MVDVEEDREEWEEEWARPSKVLRIRASSMARVVAVLAEEGLGNGGIVDVAGVRRVVVVFLSLGGEGEEGPSSSSMEGRISRKPAMWTV